MNLFRIGKRPNERDVRDSTGWYFSRPDNARAYSQPTMRYDAHIRRGDAHITSIGRQGRDRVCVDNERTFNERGLQIWGPDDLALALHCLPALAASDDGLDGVIDAGGGGDGVGEVVRGRDVYVLGEVVAVIGSHGWRVRASVRSAAEGEE